MSKGTGTTHERRREQEEPRTWTLHGRAPRLKYHLHRQAHRASASARASAGASTSGDSVGRWNARLGRSKLAGRLRPSSTVSHVACTSLPMPGERSVSRLKAVVLVLVLVLFSGVWSGIPVFENDSDGYLLAGLVPEERSRRWTLDLRPQLLADPTDSVRARSASLTTTLRSDCPLASVLQPFVTPTFEVLGLDVAAEDGVLVAGGHGPQPHTSAEIWT